MALSTTTRLKCRACGSVYPTTYSLKEHSDREHCDGPLDYYCDTCRAFVPKPDTVCPACEEKAQQAAEQKRRQEQRRREIAERKKSVERQVDSARRNALSTLARKKCRECGGVYSATYIEEEHHDNENCDGPLAFFCETCRRFVSGLVCAVCEENAQRAEEERRERLEQERLAAEARERLRREREERLRIEREAQERREKAFKRVAMIPACIALGAAVMCFLLAAQLFTHGTFFVPYSGTAIVSLLVLGITSALSLFVVAMFFSL